MLFQYFSSQKYLLLFFSSQKYLLLYFSSRKMLFFQFPKNAIFVSSRKCYFCFSVLKNLYFYFFSSRKAVPEEATPAGHPGSTEVYTKHSSLLRKPVNYSRKMYYSTGPRKFLTKTLGQDGPILVLAFVINFPDLSLPQPNLAF